MEIDPQAVIQILAERLANEFIQSAVKEAALRQVTDPDAAVGIPTDDGPKP